MYNWQIDALEQPWKVRCPHCRELFPKNDFAAFYRSGLDAHGVFDPARADRSLLFNAEHPDPADPLHRFGVDDGEGYVEGGKRWRFIGAYLIYGQWKQAVVGGIRNLAAAYAAHRRRRLCAQGRRPARPRGGPLPHLRLRRRAWSTKGPGLPATSRPGTTPARRRARLALAYDEVFEALRGDADLVRSCPPRRSQHASANPKTTCADVQRNIEDGILRDTLDNRAQDPAPTIRAPRSPDRHASRPCWAGRTTATEVLGTAGWHARAGHRRRRRDRREGPGRLHRLHDPGPGPVPGGSYARADAGLPRARCWSGIPALTPATASTSTLVLACASARRTPTTRRPATPGRFAGRRDQYAGVLF